MKASRLGLPITLKGFGFIYYPLLAYDAEAEMGSLPHEKAHNK